MKTFMDTKNMPVAPTVNAAQPSYESGRRLKEARYKRGSRRVTFVAILGSPKVAEAFCNVVNTKKHKRAISKILLDAIEEIAGIDPERRDRDLYLQPQVPRSLQDKFNKLAREKGFGTGTKYLRYFIARWVSPNTGSRIRRQTRPRRFRRPGNPDRFAAKGREIIRNEKELIGNDKERTAGKALPRYAFDAGKSKAAIVEIAKEMGMTYSEFFSALMDRECARWKQDQGKLKARVTPCLDG
jgi:hypothetical protein